MANYIITVESELDLQRRIMQKDRELFLKEKEKVKLENELKQLTISILEFDRNMSKTASPERDTKTANRHIVSRAKLFITSNFDKNIMLGDVARAVYISPNYFSTLFKSITGHTFSTYLTKTRIDRAGAPASKPAGKRIRIVPCEFAEKSTAIPTRMMSE